MPALKMIKIKMGRVRRGRGRSSSRGPAKTLAEEVGEDESRLELEILYMIGAPAS